MKKRITSCVIAIALAISMISTNAFVVDTKAVSRAEVIENVVDGLKKDVEKFHRTHIRDKSGSRIVINEDYKEPKRTKKRGSVPSSYMAPYTSVKDQKAFGACWMFGEISSLESNLLNKAGYDSGLVSEDPIDFSEAQGVYVQYNRETEDGTLTGDESPDSDNDSEYFTTGYYGYNEGGWALDASMAVSANKGATFEEENPYISQGSTKRGVDSKAMATVAAANYRVNHFDIENADLLPEVYEVVANSRRVYHPSNRDIWKSMLCQNGALSSNYYQDSSDKYHHGWGLDESEYELLPNFWMFDANARSKYGTNHVITIVGYDDNYSKYNFMEPYTNQKYDSEVGEVVYIKVDADNEPEVEFDENGHLVSIETSDTEIEGYAPFIVPLEDGTWHIKNSYGKEEDGKKIYDDGIVHMSYCEQTLSETISSVVLEDLNQIQNGEKTYDTTLSHSSLQGDSATNGFEKGDKVAEIYNIEDDKDFELGQIGYWTGRADTTTKVEIYDDLSDESDPESGTLVYSSDETTDFCEGYHTIKLSNKVTLTHGTCASVVVTQNHENDSCLMIELDYASSSDADYSFNCNEGDTFYYTDDDWYSREEIDEMAQEDGLTIANSTVKLFGNAKKVEPSSYTVTVDGVENEVQKGDDFTFPNTSENGYANADYTTFYAPGQTITPNENITASSIENIDFEIEPGASIDLTGKDGIRFLSNATYPNEDFLNSSNVELGTLIAPEDIVSEKFDGEIDLDLQAEYGNKYIVKVVNQGWNAGITGSFAAGIIYLKEYNWSRQLQARGYMILKYSDGSKKTFYTGMSDKRSIVEVASNLRDQGYPGMTEEQIASIQKFLD